MLCTLETFGALRPEELAERLGWDRARDLRVRHLDPMVEMGLVLESEGVYEIAQEEDYEAAQEKVKTTAYSTVRRRRKRSHTPEGRVVTSVEETGRVASESAREEMDRRRYELEREAFNQDWEAGLIAGGERYSRMRAERSLEREMRHRGSVLVEFEGAEVEDLERIAPDGPDDEAAVAVGADAVFEMARKMLAC